MKNLILIITITAFSIPSNAQTEEKEFILPDSSSVAGNKPDTTRLKIGYVKFLIITGEEKKEQKDTVQEKQAKSYTRKKHWAGIDLGIAGYLSPQQSFGMNDENRLFELDYSRSITWNINFIEKNFKLYKNYIGIVSGMGFSINNYHFNTRSTALAPYTDSLYMIETGDITQKHFLHVSYLTIPLLIEFNTHRNPENSLHFAAGVIGGYRIGSKSVRIIEFEDRKSKHVIRDHYNLAPFNLNATARFGFGNFNLFASYALTELFHRGRGPELFPVSAGITLMGF